MFVAYSSQMTSIRLLKGFKANLTSNQLYLVGFVLHFSKVFMLGE